MYTIRFQPELDLLDITWQGIFEPDGVTAYARECLARFTEQGLRPGYRLRIDMSGSTVQPRETLVSFERNFRDFPKASRIAVVTPSALFRLQVLRVMTQPYLRVFDTPREAMTWLLADIGSGRERTGAGNDAPAPATIVKASRSVPARS